MKGQHSDVMMILVGSVFAVGLLTIIYVYVGSLQSPLSAFEIVQDTLLKAYSSPNFCFSAEKVPFEEKEIIPLNKIVGATVHPVLKTSIITCTADSCTASSKSVIPIAAKCSGQVCDLRFGSSKCQ